MNKISPVFPGAKNLINDFLGTAMNRTIADFVGADMAMSNPALNIIEAESNYTLELSAPGFQKTDFTIAIEDNQLAINGKKTISEETSNAKYTRREFAFSEFKRKIDLPKNINTENIQATYVNGILNIILPKNEVDKGFGKKTIEID